MKGWYVSRQARDTMIYSVAGHYIYLTEVSRCLMQNVSVIADNYHARRFYKNAIPG